MFSGATGKRLLFNNQAGFYKRLDFVFAPPGFGFFEFSAVDPGDDVDPAGRRRRITLRTILER